MHTSTKIQNTRYGFESELRTPKSLRKRLKGWLARLPASYTAKLVAHWPDLRLWQAAHLHPDTPVYANRQALHDALAAEHLPAKLAYLEFGCAAGVEVEKWARRCADPDCRFWGFDTFTGMPEEWRGLGWRVEKGTWSQGGTLPQTQDCRVAYVKGRFQDSLPSFLAETQLFDSFDHVVVHIDAGLYSAALYVLTMMHPVLDRATVLFDEFDCPMDEVRALNDYSSAYGVRYEVLGTSDACEKIAIRFLPKDAAPVP